MSIDNLDRLITEIREEAVEPNVVKAAAARVREQLLPEGPAVAAMRGPMLRECRDFEALMPAFLDKSLPSARALLLEDHLGSCVSCRHTLERARSGNVRVLPRPKAASNHVAPATKWAVAAMLLAGVGAGTFTVIRSLVIPPGVRASVRNVSGILYAVRSDGSEPVFAGRELRDRDHVRTAKGSTATLRLLDGSLVEMNERSEVSVTSAARGTTIHLGHGKVIVQAAKQGKGALYVSTADCQVMVKGTIFAVTSGVKGSRVSVVEGAVKVDAANRSELLHPGEQVSTDPSVEKIPVAADVAWSENAARYLSLLGDFSTIQKQLASLPSPALRTHSQLLDSVPAGTVLYAAIPNVGGTLSEANRLLQERIQQSPVLRDWWAAQQSSGRPSIDEMVNKIQTISSYLGDEVVLAVGPGDQGGKAQPLLLAEVKRPGLSEYLTSELATMNAKSGRNAFRLLSLQDNSPAPASATNGQLVFSVRNNLLAISPASGQAALIGNQTAGQETLRATDSAFYERIQQAYASGANWLFCVNMEQIRERSVVPGGPMNAAHTVSGLNDVQYLVLERKEVNGEIKNQATLSFGHYRAGLASWLAAPGPMGTLDFVSPDASLAASFVLKNPGALIDELLSAAGTGDQDVMAKLDEFQNKTGVDLRNDVAKSLGGELTFALDGPVLPTPSWKLAVEVYDSNRLQDAIAKLVNAANSEPGSHAQVALTKSQAGSLTIYTLTAQNGDGTTVPFEIDYAFVDGYLVAGSSRNLITAAIQNRSTGYTLTNSQKFRSVLPHDGHTSFSAIVYHDFSGIVGPLADQMKSLNSVTPAQRQSIQALKENSAPGLIYAYGDTDKITVAANGSLFGFNLDMLAMPKMLGGILHASGGPQVRAN